MAAAAPSPLASSVQKTNGAKLSRLLIDGGTTVLRNIFDSIHSPPNLTAGLNANYPTLKVLLKKRVLRKAQWDQLFPPGGLTPNSKTFDITLLFVLLTNICRLSPPVLGWHINPHPTDNSREANLARIKFYRNELYGHVSSTGIDTPIFNALWREISSVLVALGLNQAEIDKLKAEHCGEEDYVDVLLDWADSEEDIKSQLSEIRQYQATTQQKIEEVCQTQLDDHEKLEYSKSKLDDVCHTQKYLQETLQEVKKAVNTFKEGRDTDRVEEQVLQNLAKSDFKGDIEYHAGRYQEGTREWVFNKVENWLDDRSSQNRVMVISANAGMGKSVISAVISKRIQEAGRLAASHFCQYNNARYRNPQLMLQSLACHLSHALPEYKQALIKQLSRNLGKDLNSMGVEELFALLFKEPLNSVADIARNMLMVIDGLDESDFQERNELLDVIANHLSKLPCWIRFLCTTRPERNIAEALKHLKPIQLESNDDKNVEDIRCFIENRTQHLIQPEKRDAIVEKLVEKSEGLMIYAYFLVLFIEENKSVLDQGDLADSLPLGISSVYHSYFKRLENELKKEVGVNEEHFLNLLSALIASREPMPIEFVSKLLGLNSSLPLERRKVLKAVSSVSSLLPILDGCLHVFHKSVKDWLMSSSSYGEHEFIMDEKEGHRILARLCADELDHLKQKGVCDVEFTSTEKYALHHGARHMFQLDENMSSCNLEKCVQTYVIDLELLCAKLCLNNSIAAEDVLWLLRQENSKLLSENSKGILNTLIFLLRKHYSTLICHPRVLFQTVLNEGGSGLSPMASDLLQNKYPEIPYLEFIHNQIQHEAVLARFQCSSSVACFDVSPKSDYLVCECENEMIQLWSLLTGKLVWERPVEVKKTFYFEAFRKVPSSPALSHYRSVVFHPTMDIVLPGILSSAYGMDGDLIPLFPESKCSFTVCSISGDKTSILTDCPDDARCIIMWSVMNGSEISRTTRCKDVVSFAWSQDGRLLAISHSTGLICLVDVQTGFGTLAEITTSKVCGMIAFAPDHRFLYCKHTPFVSLGLSRNDQFLFCLNVNDKTDHTSSLDVYYDKVSYVPWKFESPSNCGFLLGDPILCVFDGSTQMEEGVAFLLTEQSVLISYRNDREIIELLNVNELTKRTKASRAPTSLANITSVNKVAFSLSGESIYVISGARQKTVSVLDISSEKLKAEKPSWTITGLVPVREGVLFTIKDHSLELWDSQVSVRVRTWSNLPRSMYVTSVSEDLVAYVDCTTCESSPGKQVTFLDTTVGEIVSTMRISHDEVFVACNKKYQVLTMNSNHLLHLLDKTVTVWYKDFPGYGSFSSSTGGLFSPGEQFLILFNPGVKGGYVLEADSGRTMNIVCKNERLYICKFLTDEVCAVCTEGSTRHHFIRLFNVKSGDQLTVIDMECRVLCLDANPRKNLITIGLEKSKYNFKLIQVKLPGGNEIMKNERMTCVPEVPARTGIMSCCQCLLV